MARITILLMCLLWAASTAAAQELDGWKQGKGFGWVYGPQDEVGALNAITGPEHVRRALSDVKTGKVYDLGLLVDRRSYKWPGHSPIEVMTYRSPHGEGLDEQPIMPPESGMRWHSCALFISDNVGTQIDSLGHIVYGEARHWYNGFKEEKYGGDFGILKAGADTIPPIIARAVLIDVAGWKGVDALPARFSIGPEELRAALERQGTSIEPGDIVFIRTGVARYWGATGADHDRIGEHDSAGLNLEGAKWLVEQKGAVMIGSDTSGLEVASEDPIPVHKYLLVDQGVHIGELHNLEGLAGDKAYRFTYVAMTNRIKGATAGFAMRPIAIR